MKLRLRIDWRDCWVGYYRGDDRHYVCPLPFVVLSWPRAAVSSGWPENPPW